jgi:NTE family protein
MLLASRKSDPMSTIGLVLTGGGARAAYQAGVLRGIAEIAERTSLPFRVMTGVSAGAINAMAIAARPEDFRAATARLWETWSELQVHQVFRTDVTSISQIGARWMRDLSLGGLVGGTTSRYLLDTAPLRRLLSASIDFSRIADNVQSGVLRGVAVSATNYASGAAVTFFDGAPSIKPWARRTRLARRASIGLRHVMASSAIPIFFPPERLAGSYYGDGCVRLSAPLSPAIHLGADRLLAIGIRHPRAPHSTTALSTRHMSRIRAIDIAGVLLNAVFLDSLDSDLERMQRINRTLALLTPAARSTHPDALRPIEVLALRPSRDLGRLASAELRRLPRTLRYMLRGLGASEERGWDVFSYLAFDSAYTRLLLDLGLEDARAQADVIGAFLRGSPTTGLRQARDSQRAADGASG